MKHIPLICALVTASFGLLGSALAQGHERDNGPDPLLRNRSSGSHSPAPQPSNRNWRQNDQRDDWREGRHNDRRDHFNARGPEFYRGGYIPREYRSRNYTVTNYRMHSLQRPPRGHEWVQVGPDFVLIMIATGLIAQIVLSH